MKIFTTIKETQDFLGRQRGKTIGFVPTMGALHQGHMSLIQQAREENDVVVCSIFVNPIQFNNAEDLNKYPRTLEEDCRLLESEGCDLVFSPAEKEMYPKVVTEVFSFGDLEKVMEGRFRQGHFNGVAVVVKKLFEIIMPDRAYFGLKDYQQLQIVKAMTRQINSPVEIVSCPTVREADGLAMSSRNRRLAPDIREIVPVIYKTLTVIREKKKAMSLAQLKQWAVKQIEHDSPLKVEYFEIADATTLQPAKYWEDYPVLVACTAVWAGDVRLIDNILIS